MKRRMTALSLAAAIAIVTVVFAQPREHVLDLIAVPSIGGTLVPVEQGSVPSNRRLTSGSVVISSHSEPPPSPFTLMIERLAFDRGSYAVGESFVVEVHFRNTGRSPVLFPWSVDSSLFEATVPGSYVAVVGLQDAKTALPLGFTEMVTLYGAPNVPNSLEEILPRETVLIRVKTDWLMYEGNLRMHAVLRPSYGGRAYPAIVSKNITPVQSTGRRR